jgi:triacylglycerol lipase
MANAWLQRFITLGFLTVCAALAAWLWPSQRGWALFCLFLPVFITPFVLGFQCLCAALHNRRDPVQPASLTQWLGAWLSEWRAATLVFCWWQPFRHDAIADRLAPTPGLRGMVLVHGFFCNRALWTHWMQRLSDHKRVFIAVDLQPPFGGISDYAQAIEEAVKKVTLATGLPPVIVGHSMGGLAIRAWAQAHLGQQGDMSRIHRIITLGTPHQGTALARYAYSLNGRQMQEGSTWLAENAARLPAAFSQHCICYFSHCDNIVFPATTATLADADNRHQTGYAHVQLIFSEDIQQACFGYLEDRSCP